MTREVSYLEKPGSLRLTATLTTGILAVSCGSLFIRLAAAPPLAVAAYRVFWATVLLAPLVFAGPIGELRVLSIREWRRLFIAGAALAMHFALWVASLSYTSVASSVLLVDTTPFFIGMASWFLLKKPPKRLLWKGLVIAFAGCLLVFREDWGHSASSMRGNGLAVAGAVAMAVYFLAGATARQKLSLLAYVWPVYGIAALLLIAASLASRSPLLNYPGPTHLYLFLLGLIPQCIGHTSYNWSLRWLPPALVALISLAEPVGASALAYLILDESLSFMKLTGGCIVLLGIYVATRSEL